MKYAADLHRQGRYSVVNAMNAYANSLVRHTNGGLATAFLTEGYQGADCFAIIANSQRFSSREGYVVWDELAEKAVFVGE